MVFITRIFQTLMYKLPPNKFDCLCDEQFAAWFRTYINYLWTKTKLLIVYKSFIKIYIIDFACVTLGSQLS